jgi:hypothetical protein
MRKRSKYKPRPIMLNPIKYVIEGFAPMDKEGQIRTRLRQHDAMFALTHGQGTDDHWQVIRELLNVAAALSKTIFDGAYITEIQAAMVAHAECGRRYVKHGRYGYAGTELQTVNTAIEVYEEQLKLATMGEIGDALKVVDRAIRQKNFYASVVQERGLEKTA